MIGLESMTPNTEHLTPHTSHLTPHTSHLTPHTSQVCVLHCFQAIFANASWLPPAPNVSTFAKGGDAAIQVVIHSRFSPGVITGLWF